MGKSNKKEAIPRVVLGEIAFSVFYRASQFPSKSSRAFCLQIRS